MLKKKKNTKIKWNEKLVHQRNQQVWGKHSQINQKLSEIIQINEIRYKRNDFTEDPEDIPES